MTSERLREDLIRRVRRLRDRAPLILQIGIAVLLAWVIARDVLGHTTPFFAPVTAIVGLGLTYGQRPRRIVEVTVGVALGVLIGDVVLRVLGAGPLQMAFVVVVAMSVAVLISSGGLIVIQAGVQSIFIVALVATESAAVSRWLDAVVGGTVALAIGALAPTSPIRRPRQEATRVVRAVVATLQDVVEALRLQDAGLAVRAVGRARGIEAQLVDLRTAAAEGLAVVRQSPLKRGHLAAADAASNLVIPLDACVRNLRVLVGRASVAVARGEVVPERYIDLVEALADAGADLARVLDEHTYPSAGRQVLLRVAGRSARADRNASLSAEVIRGQVRSMVVNLLVLAGVGEDEAISLVPETYLP
ncbi:MAG: FUSC family protein [Ornithinibacter sp.]